MRYQTAPRPGDGSDPRPKRATGIEPAPRAWKAHVQPLHLARASADYRFAPRPNRRIRAGASAKLIGSRDGSTGRSPALFRLLRHAALSRPRMTHARTLHRLGGGGAGARGGALAASEANGRDDRRPNVVFILTDDMTSSELAGDAERAVADRRAGDDLQRGLRLVPALLSVEGDDVERAVHAQPRRPRQLPAERKLVQVPRARVQRPAGLAPGRRLLQRPHRQVHERLLDRGRHACPSRRDGTSGTGRSPRTRSTSTTS